MIIFLLDIFIIPSNWEWSTVLLKQKRLPRYYISSLSLLVWWDEVEQSLTLCRSPNMDLSSSYFWKFFQSKWIVALFCGSDDVLHFCWKVKIFLEKNNCVCENYWFSIVPVSYLELLKLRNSLVSPSVPRCLNWFHSQSLMWFMCSGFLMILNFIINILIYFSLLWIWFLHI